MLSRLVAKKPGPSALVTRVETMSRRPATMGAAVAADVISLAMGEPSQGTPEPIVDAAVAALHAGRTRYEALTGSPALRSAIASHLTDAYGREVAAEQIVCTHGGSGGLAAAVLATIDPGDRVVIPEPTYSLYADHVALAGGEVVWVASRPDGSIDIERLRAALGGARMLILCSPGNPTGLVVGRDELQLLADATAAAGAYLVCDEAYADIVFDEVPFASALELDASEHLICSRTFSKTYAMTGWRLGYVIANPRVAAAINLVHRTIAGGLATFVQDAGVEALRTPAAELHAIARSYQARRDLVLEALGDLPGVEIARPQGAFYAFVRVDSPLTSDELVAELAKAGVLVRSGREYGPSGEGAFRISFATGTEALTEGLGRVARVLTQVVELE